MNRIIALTLILLVLQTWKKVQAGTLDRFSGSGNGGKYVDNESKWKYKPDSRGKYVHVPNPYNGGYGDNGLPYDHIDNPYASLDDPFANQFYNDPKPAIYREYGAPLFNLRK